MAAYVTAIDEIEKRKLTYLVSLGIIYLEIRGKFLEERGERHGGLLR